jgi:CheY-like chemotaxis protein
MTIQDSKPCVVVAEDQDDSREVLSQLLARSGYAVHAAATIAEAVDLARRHGCDLLVADIGLPDGSGLELMRQVQAMHTHAKGIALTGLTSPEDVQLPKPISFPALLSEMERLLNPPTVRRS